MTTDYSTLDNRALDAEIARRMENVPITFVEDRDGVWVYRTGIDDLEDSPWTYVHPCSTDANAALALAHETGQRWKIDLDPHNKHAASVWVKGRGWVHGESDTPARAISIAWLLWKDANDGT
jgi:hypothetical protein